MFRTTRTAAAILFYLFLTISTTSAGEILPITDGGPIQELNFPSNGCLDDQWPGRNGGELLNGYQCQCGVTEDIKAKDCAISAAPLDLVMVFSGPLVSRQQVGFTGAAWDVLQEAIHEYLEAEFGPEQVRGWWVDDGVIIMSQH